MESDKPILITPSSYLPKIFLVNLTEVTFAWDTTGLPGGPFLVVFLVVANVSDDGTASTTFPVSYSEPGIFNITANIVDGSDIVATADHIQVDIIEPVSA